MAGSTDSLVELRARKAASRARARRSGPVLFIAAAALPVALWRQVMADIYSEFELTWRYLLTGCLPWTLMALGLACFIVAAVLDLRDRNRRFYGPGSAAWAGWGVTLYLLGFALATQVAQITEGISTY